MPIDDLWYLKKLDPDGKRVPSKRHGQGRRYRVRFEDAHGGPATKFFHRKRDAEAWDLEVRTNPVKENKVDQSERQRTFREYGERWRLSREVGWALETRKRVESNLRNNLYPEFGDRQMRTITLTSVLEWLTMRLASDTPKTTLKLYFELLDAVLTAAVADKMIPENPCDGVKLSQVLARHVPGAKVGADRARGVGAARRGPGQVPGRNLAGCRAGLPLRRGHGHGRHDPLRRPLQQRTSWPKEHGGFHALRHFFATTLITNHAEPQDVQRLLRHKTLRITLETYVHWWPRRERRRGVIGDVLRAASSQAENDKIKASLY